MSQSADFFAEFSPVSKAQWLEQIAKDLKGKPLADLHWQLDEKIAIDPFRHADDSPEPPLPLRSDPATWHISECIDAPDAPKANRQALEALAFGAQSLHFPLRTPQAAAELGLLLDRIRPDFIDLQFSGAGVDHGPAAVLSALAARAAAQGIEAGHLQGGLFYDLATASGNIQDWRYLADLLGYAQAELPGFRCITIDGRAGFAGTAATADELAALIRRGMAYFEKMQTRGVEPAALAGQIQFCLCVGPSYFVEIAKLRALQLLWMNVLKSWGAPPSLPALDVHFAPTAYTDDLYTNMIRATTMAMSAVLGGAQRLTVLPYDAGREAAAQYPSNFSRRIARNVQHLLQLESGFDALADPAAGSYYIENLTTQLAEAGWEKATR
ncbi:MAG: hypothetical protein JNK89_05095 [Saprospiraceae bacterium]|nr:hypothetical protein [Saprospiraceae bacterium]